MSANHELFIAVKHMIFSTLMVTMSNTILFVAISRGIAGLIHTRHRTTAHLAGLSHGKDGREHENAGRHCGNY
jgi:tetrahydromethanopterin S-methyltransferase subunit E